MFLIVLESTVSRVIEMDIYCSSYRRMEREITDGRKRGRGLQCGLAPGLALNSPWLFGT